MSTPSVRTGRPASRREQAAATRALLLRTAERLYAERGLADVSHRQIVEAAGVANNSALTYHFGTRGDLIRAIARDHAEPIFRQTRRMLDAARESGDPRALVAAFVLPYTEHLATLGTPSWCARFTAQLSADPAFAAEVDADPDLRGLIDDGLAALRERVPDLEVRSRMVRLTIIHTCAEQERAAATTGTPAAWDAIGASLTDALTGLLLAPGSAR